MYFFLSVQCSTTSTVTYLNVLLFALGPSVVQCFIFETYWWLGVVYVGNGCYVSQRRNVPNLVKKQAKTKTIFIIGKIKSTCEVGQLSQQSICPILQIYSFGKYSMCGCGLQVFDLREAKSEVNAGTDSRQSCLRSRGQLPKGQGHKQKRTSWCFPRKLWPSMRNSWRRWPRRMVCLSPRKVDAAAVENVRSFQESQ